MKILSVIHTMASSHGGPPEVLRNQVSIINKNEKIINILKLSKLSFTFLIKCFLLKSYRLKIYNFLKKYDIIHFHEVWNLKAIFIVYFANKILIKHFFVGHGYLDTWSIRDKYLKKKLFIKFFLQYAYKSSSASFFSTKSEFYEARKNIKVHSTFVIPNGLSLKKFKNQKKKINVKKKILFFGRIHEKKGLQLLLETIKILPKSYFDKFTFEITGPGESNTVNKIKAMIKDNSLTGKVNYNEPIYDDKKINYIKKHDVFILPSYEEGDSIALKEALGSYLPVIISKQCRLEIVEKYKAGIVIETNIKSLYDALINLEKLDLGKMGENARKLIEENYDNNNCSMRLKKVYYDLFNSVSKSPDWIFDAEEN
tara:strand:+ start:2559 stop:3665 length:1107 start_codon:yes stop_codon:yes gene_type:complete